MFGGRVKTYLKIYARYRLIASVLLCLSVQALPAMYLFSSPAAGTEKANPEELYNRAYQLLLTTRIEEDTLNADTPPRCESINFNTYLYPKYERALEEFLQFQRQHPTHQSADDALYYAYLILKKMPQEVLQDKSWSSKYPDNPSFLLVKLEKSYPASPLMEEVYYERGTGSFDQGKYDEAVKDFQRLVKNYPASCYLPEIKYCIAMIYKDKKDYAKALPAFKKLKVEYPQHKRLGDIEYAIGECLYYTAKARNYQPEPLQDWKEITSHFKTVVRRYPEYANQAREINTQASKDIVGLLIKGDTLDNLMEARKLIIALLKDNKKDDEASKLLLSLLITTVNKINKLNIEQADRLYNYPNHSYAIAQNLYEQVTKQGEEAGTYEKSIGKVDEAIEYQDYARIRIAQCLKFLGKESQAAQMLAELEKQFPASPLLAEACYEKGLTVMWNAHDPKRYKETIEQFRQMVENYPSSDRADDALFYIGYMYLWLRDMPKAKEAFSQVATKYPGSPRVKFAEIYIKQIDEGKVWRDDE